MKTLWFKRKTYGWGWTPVTWQGWGITIGYIVLLICLGAFLGPDNKPELTGWFIGILVTLTMLFILVAYKTGEKPRWQWGNRDGNKKQ